MLFSPRAKFDLARRLQAGERVPLGEIFSFLSGLYFRGKLTYAQAFARPTAAIYGALVITSNRGLVPAHTPVALSDLQEMSRNEIDHTHPDYRLPLLRDAMALSQALPVDCPVVLLGSIATSKYGDILLLALGERLVFPVEFVGRGDMSRGGLMLRCVADNQELTYVPVSGTKRHGARPIKLAARAGLFKAACAGKLSRVAREASAIPEGGR